MQTMASSSTGAHCHTFGVCGITLTAINLGLKSSLQQLCDFIATAN
jgi:hypothetical protein